ncbi:hypothetical protein B0H21DRAFT_691827, partial [Amylocystis lapponica]
PSITQFFEPATQTSIAIPHPSQTTPARMPEPCQNLHGGDYREYVLRTQTRMLGGISLKFRAAAARQLFPYKLLPVRKSESDKPHGVKIEIPPDGNKKIKEEDWTENEKHALDHTLRAWARWIVDYTNQSVRSTHCMGTTTNTSRICDACEGKNQEAGLPEAEQHAIHVAREKYAPTSLRNADSRVLQATFRDPLIFKVFQSLERHDDLGCFLQLYQQAREGKLGNHKTFTELCAVFSDRVRRESKASTNPKLKNGMRYVVARSPDALQNPALEYENVVRVKRLMDSISYTGPVALAGDCTKVRKRLTYSNDFGSHVLGSVLPLSECSVEETADIDKVIKRVTEEDAMASQARAILVKIPLPHVPPLVIALIPTDGSDNADLIHSQHKLFLRMAAELEIAVVSMAADGAASELAAQSYMDHEASDLPHLSYDYNLYGIHLRAPASGKTPYAD